MPPHDLLFPSHLPVSKQVSVNRSRLYRSPSMPEKLDRPALKRIVKGQDNETPVKVKRRCSLIQEEPEGVREPAQAVCVLNPYPPSLSCSYSAGL